MSVRGEKNNNDIWQRVRDHGAPLLEDDQAVFVWFGRQSPFLVGDFNNWDWDSPLVLKSFDENIWTYTLKAQKGSYIEYSYIDEAGERLPDPFNANTVTNGLGERNHYFYMSGAGPTALAQRQNGVPQGKVTPLLIEPGHLIAGGNRTLYLYQPAAPGPHPLLVVLDGNDYLRRASLNVILDNLIFQDRIRPIALAMVQNNHQSRFLEYACNDATLSLLQRYILPLAQERLELVDHQQQPGVHGIMGASMGGLMALYAGLRLPGVFGSVLSQSGAFRLKETESVIFDLIELSPPRPVDVWLDAGFYDMALLLQANREMYRLLTRRGYRVAYHEYHGGHNYPSWRDDLWRGLEYLFQIQEQ